MPDVMSYVIIGLSISVPVVILLVFLSKYYVVIEGDEVAYISGAFRAQRHKLTGEVRDFTILKAGGTIVWPILDRCRILSTAPREIKLDVSVRTRDFLRVRIDAVLSFKIDDSTEDALLFAVQLSRMTEEEMITKVGNIAHGLSKVVLSELKLEQVYQDRRKMEETVEDVIQSQFDKLGLRIISYGIRHIDSTQKEGVASPIDLIVEMENASRKRSHDIAVSEAEAEAGRVTAEIGSKARIEMAAAKLKEESEAVRLELEKEQTIRALQKEKEIVFVQSAKEERIAAKLAERDQQIAERDAGRAIKLQELEASKQEESVLKERARDLAILEQRAREAEKTAYYVAEEAIQLANQATNARIAEDKKKLLVAQQELAELEFELAKRKGRLSALVPALVDRERIDVESDARRNQRLIDSDAALQASAMELQMSRNRAQGELVLMQALAQGNKEKLLAEVVARKEMGAILEKLRADDKLLLFYKETMDKAPELIHSMLGDQGLAGIFGEISRHLQLGEVTIVDTGGQANTHSKIAGLANVSPEILLNFVAAMKAVGFGDLIERLKIDNDLLPGRSHADEPSKAVSDNV
jgi:flotillin